MNEKKNYSFGLCSICGRSPSQARTFRMPDGYNYPVCQECAREKPEKIFTKLWDWFLAPNIAKRNWYLIQKRVREEIKWLPEEAQRLLFDLTYSRTPFITQKRINDSYSRLKGGPEYKELVRQFIMEKLRNLSIMVVPTIKKQRLIQQTEGVDALKEMFLSKLSPEERKVTWGFSAVNEVYSFWGKGKPIEDVDKEATFVHMVDFPTLGRLKQLIAHCPKLRVIRIEPVFEHLLSSRSYLEFAKKHRVNLICGHHRYHPGLNLDLRADQKFKDTQNFLLNLSLEAQRKWDELKTLGIPGIEIVERYFCLKGEKRVSMATLAKEKGVRFDQVSRRIKGILRYLNPEYQTSKQGIIRARAIERTLVPKLKREVRIKSEKTKYSQYGGIPVRLPREKWKTFAELKELWVKDQGRWGELHLKKPKTYLVLMMRYSIDGKRIRVLTQPEIGRKFGVSRQRIQQIEKEGVDFLLKNKKEV